MLKNNHPYLEVLRAPLRNSPCVHFRLKVFGVKTRLLQPVRFVIVDGVVHQRGCLERNGERIHGRGAEISSNFAIEHIFHVISENGRMDCFFVVEVVCKNSLENGRALISQFG